MHVCLSVREYATCRGTCGGQKRLLGPLELQLQVGMSNSTWMLGTRPESSARVASTLAAEPPLDPLSPSLLSKKKLWLLTCYTLCPSVVYFPAMIGIRGNSEGDISLFMTGKKVLET